VGENGLGDDAGAVYLDYTVAEQVRVFVHVLEREVKRRTVNLVEAVRIREQGQAARYAWRSYARTDGNSFSSANSGLVANQFPLVGPAEHTRAAAEVSRVVHKRQDIVSRGLC
jgi:hypothetical protein